MGHRKQQTAAACIEIPAAKLRGQRWDPGFWIGRPGEFAARCAWPCRPLGDFIERITYGPIVTGRKPSPVEKGIAIVDQRAVRPSGVVLDEAVLVAEGCDYDLPRCRLQRRDIVLCRSGAGTLAKKRFTVFDRRQQATVSCFVDLIRLREINPYYVATFLRSPTGWSQIARLLNGVGTPNLSFGEIRSLVVPLLPEADQAEAEAAWAPVRRLHAAGRLGDAEDALDRLAAEVERRVLRPAAL